MSILIALMSFIYAFTLFLNCFSYSRINFSSLLIIWELKLNVFSAVWIFIHIHTWAIFFFYYWIIFLYDHIQSDKFLWTLFDTKSDDWLRGYILETEKNVRRLIIHSTLSSLSTRKKKHRNRHIDNLIASNQSELSFNHCYFIETDP